MKIDDVMGRKLEYSFDDEPVSKFCYDLHSSEICVYFDGYWDLLRDVYVNKPCKWTISEWEYVNCKIGDELKVRGLREQIGIFSLILYMKFNEEGELELLASTLDNRYLTIYFGNPKMSLADSNKQ